MGAGKVKNARVPKRNTNTRKRVSRETPGDPDSDLALRMYRHAFTARSLDHTETILKRTGKGFFQIFGAGHEIIQVALAPFLRPGVDFIFPYYRDLALNLAYGITPYESLLMSVGSSECPG